MSPPAADPKGPAAVRRESLAALARVYHDHAAATHETALTVVDLELRDDLHAAAAVLLALAHALEDAGGGDPLGLDSLNLAAQAWLGEQRYSITPPPPKGPVPA